MPLMNLQPNESPSVDSVLDQITIRLRPDRPNCC